MAGLFDEPSVKYARVAVERGVDQFPDGLTYGVPERLLPLSVGYLNCLLDLFQEIFQPYELQREKIG